MDLNSLLSQSTKNNLSLQKIRARGRTIPSFIHFLSPKPELMHKKKVFKCNLFYKTDVYKKASLEPTESLSTLESIIEGSAAWLKFVLQDIVWPTDPGVPGLPLPLLQTLPQVLQHGAVGRVWCQVDCLQRVGPVSMTHAWFWLHIRQKTTLIKSI